MIFTPEDVAKRWNISAYTVRQMLNDGRLQGFKAGREWRVTEDALRRFENTPARPDKETPAPVPGPCIC